MSEQFRVILFKEDGQWVAQGLEHDICAVASSLDELHGRFEVTVRIESSREGGLKAIGPAPQHFFHLWDRKAGAFTPEEATDSFEYGMAA